MVAEIRCCPTRSALLYTGEVKSVDVPVPSSTELRTIQERLREEVNQANLSLNAGLARARPSVNNCGRCPVRQLCDEYWEAPETVPLHHPRSPVTKGDGPSYCDVKIVELPSPWARDGHLFGTAVSDVLGKVYLFVEREQCPVESSRQPIEARLLSAKIHSGLVGFEVRPTHSSEVFWELPRELDDRLSLAKYRNETSCIPLRLSRSSRKRIFINPT